MTRHEQPTTALPLDYEPERPARRTGTLILTIIAVALAAAVVTWLVLGIGMTRTVVVRGGPVITGSVTDASRLPAPDQEQMQARAIPPEGVAITLKQRESAWLPGGRLKLAIDDITGGQVPLAVTDDDGNVVLAQRSVREEDVVVVPDSRGSGLRIRVLELTNHLMSDDFAEFLILPPQATPGAGD